MSLKDYKDLGMNINSDRFILPEHYTPIEKPYFKGIGNLNIIQLEELCEKFEEYCHQQAIIKRELIKAIKS